MSSSRSLKPIAVYDSGMGGLSILKALIEAFPNENFVYLGDTAHLPYGAKSPDLLRKIVSRCLTQLVSLDVKLVVVACNSASTVLPETFDLPLLGVIEAGCEAAVRASKNKKIGVIGTQATISSHAYKKGILKIMSEVEVFEQASPLLVPLVEEGWTDDPVTNLIVYRYLGQILPHQPDTLILGCTHYPFLRASVQKIAGPNIKLVDSAEVLVEKLRHVYQEQADLKNNSNIKGQSVMYVTEDSEGYRKRVEQFLSPFHFSEFKTIEV